jgi:hypothetical protein
MTFFSYHPPDTNITLIGTDKDQIKSTLKHYNLSIPPEEEMRQLARVVVMSALGAKDPNISHFFQAEVRDKVSFQVHASAFQYIKKIAKDYSDLKRGDLYKFDTGQAYFGLLFLPEYVMQGLSDYDWDQHSEQVSEWMKTEKIVLTEAVETRRYFVKPD